VVFYCDLVEVLLLILCWNIGDIVGIVIGIVIVIVVGIVGIVYLIVIDDSVVN